MRTALTGSQETATISVRTDIDETLRRASAIPRSFTGAFAIIAPDNEAVLAGLHAAESVLRRRL